METTEFRHLDLYQFEYQLIPRLIQLNRDNLNSVEEFLYYMSDLSWILDTAIPSLGLKCDFDTSDLEITGKVKYNNFIIVYTFPFPAYSPLAKFGAIVLNSKGAKYYTLEKAGNIDSNEDNAWFLGQKTEESHINYGQVSDCSTIEDFVSLLNKKGFLEKKSFLSRILKKLKKK